jgi:hypothetical protein
MSFDSNAMAELRHVSADRYQRNGGGGAFKVYATAQAYYEARGYKELSPFRRACIEMLHRFRQVAELQKENYRIDCLTSKEGWFDDNGSIPF